MSDQKGGRRGEKGRIYVFDEADLGLSMRLEEAQMIQRLKWGVEYSPSYIQCVEQEVRKERSETRIM